MKREVKDLGTLRIRMTTGIGLFAITWATGGVAAELLIGAATTSITPDKPVALDGQFNTRIAKSADNPITATAVAIETRSEGRMLDQAILVSCDIVAIRPPILGPLRSTIAKTLPDSDPQKLVLTARGMKQFHEATVALAERRLTH